MCKDTAKIRKFANMITKNRIKFIRSLEQKKYRKVHGCFVVEGPKVVEDMLPAFECEYVACTREWLDRHVPLPSSCECDEVSEDELRRKTELLKEGSRKYNGLVFAIGYAFEDRSENVRSALRLADERMYEDKKRYYMIHPEKKRSSVSDE